MQRVVGEASGSSGRTVQPSSKKGKTDRGPKASNFLKDEVILPLLEAADALFSGEKVDQ